MTLHEAAAQARLEFFWRGVPIGTRVTARRDDGRTLQTMMLSEAFRTASGVACVRLAAVSGNYPLDHVSFGWGEPTVRPSTGSITIAAALDPAPNPDEPWTAIGRFALALVLSAFVYAVGSGLVAIVDAVFR